MRWKMKTVDPLDRADDLLCWYDFSDASTVTLNGSSISAVADKGPLGYDMIQGTAVDQPLYTNQINGLNVATSDGLTQYLQTVALLDDLPYSMSYFCVYQSVGVQTGNASIFSSTVSSDDNSFQIAFDGDRLGIDGDDMTDIDIEPSAGNTTLSLGENHFNYAENWNRSWFNNVYQNESSLTWKDNDGNGPRFENFKLFTNIAGNIKFNGHICETIVYFSPNYIGEGMRDRLSQYLMSKWGIV